MTAFSRLEDSLGEFSSQYETLRQHIEPVLRDVTVGAAATDGGLLTDHGPQHIDAVIKRASALTAVETCKLSEFEVFLLLAAINLHDVGNIHGRTAHQFTANDVGMWLGSSVSPDVIVRRTIIRIAAAHTAGDAADKDTIRSLPRDDYILNHPVRPQMLAAILRFADELADERIRASRYLMEKRRLPKGAEAFHLLAPRSALGDHRSHR